MATFTSRTVTSTRREWMIPAAEPWGANYAEVCKALAVAEIAFREAHGLAPTDSLTDDWIRFFPGDDEIVISFTTEQPTTP